MSFPMKSPALLLFQELEGVLVVGRSAKNEFVMEAVSVIAQISHVYGVSLRARVCYIPRGSCGEGTATERRPWQRLVSATT